MARTNSGQLGSNGWQGAFQWLARSAAAYLSTVIIGKCQFFCLPSFSPHLRVCPGSRFQSCTSCNRWWYIRLCGTRRHKAVIVTDYVLWWWKTIRSYTHEIIFTSVFARRLCSTPFEQLLCWCKSLLIPVMYDYKQLLACFFIVVLLAQFGLSYIHTGGLMDVCFKLTGVTACHTCSAFSYGEWEKTSNC